ncbi:hypothetical protein MTO96_013907 [Rhipicephalus appendiculatus]
MTSLWKIAASRLDAGSVRDSSGVAARNESEGPWTASRSLGCAKRLPHGAGDPRRPPQQRVRATGAGIASALYRAAGATAPQIAAAALFTASPALVPGASTNGPLTEPATDPAIQNSAPSSRSTRAILSKQSRPRSESPNNVASRSVAITRRNELRVPVGNRKKKFLFFALPRSSPFLAVLFARGR